MAGSRFSLKSICTEKRPGRKRDRRTYLTGAYFSGQSKDKCCKLLFYGIFHLDESADKIIFHKRGLFRFSRTCSVCELRQNCRFMYAFTVNNFVRTVNWNMLPLKN